MGKTEIEAFLSHLAVQGQVAVSTQNQALSALLFFYCEVLNLEIIGVDAVRVKRPQYLVLLRGVWRLPVSKIGLAHRTIKATQ